MPQELLARHPPWRRLLIVSLVLPVVIVAAVLAFAWPTARIHPRDVPIGVVGTTSGGSTLMDHLARADPGGFVFRLYADDAAARSAIAHRAVYGAFEIAPGSLEVLEASATSSPVARLLDTLGRGLADTATQQAAAQGLPPVQLT